MYTFFLVIYTFWQNIPLCQLTQRVSKQVDRLTTSKCKTNNSRTLLSLHERSRRRAAPKRRPACFTSRATSSTWEYILPIQVNKHNNSMKRNKSDISLVVNCVYSKRQLGAVDSVCLLKAPTTSIFMMNDIEFGAL
jgi:hypothetical protein